MSCMLLRVQSNRENMSYSSIVLATAVVRVDDFLSLPLMYAVTFHSYSRAKGLSTAIGGRGHVSTYMQCLTIKRSAGYTINTAFTLIKCKILRTQGYSKIAVVLSNAHRIFRHMCGRIFTRSCISYRNAYPINARSSIFRNIYDSNATQGLARF